MARIRVETSTYVNKLWVLEKKFFNWFTH